MNITHLELKNFRGFADKVLEFNPHCNVIVGNGKTSLSEALSVAVAGWFSGLRDKFDSRPIREDDVRFVVALLPEPDNLPHYKIHQPTGSHQYPCEVMVKGFIDNKELSWKQVKNSVNGTTTTSGTKEIKALSFDYDVKLRTDEDVVFPLLAYYGKERMMNNFVKKSPHRLPQRLLGYANGSVGKPTLNKYDVIHWFYQKAYKQLQHKKVNKKLVLMNDILISALTSLDIPCTHIEYNFHLESVVLTINNENKCLSHLNNGLQNLFLLFADMVRRAILLNYSVLNNETIKETQGIVIIDDLEIGLSVEQQCKIIDVLKNTFPKVQFFCTTQSESMIENSAMSKQNDNQIAIIDLSKK